MTRTSSRLTVESRHSRSAVIDLRAHFGQVRDSVWRPPQRSPDFREHPPMELLTTTAIGSTALLPSIPGAALMWDEAEMKLGQRRVLKELLDPVEDGSAWRSLASPMAVALAFALMIGGLFISTCNGE